MPGNEERESALQLARVDEMRARVFLAEGRLAEAEQLARAAAEVLERGGEETLRAAALQTQGAALARLGRRGAALAALRRAGEVAERAGDPESAGRAALMVIEELGGRLGLRELLEAFERADALLSRSGNPAHTDRLLECARRVLSAVGAGAEAEVWRGFSYNEALKRFEARLIERALRDAGGVITKAARLLGVKRQSLSSMLHTRHRELLSLCVGNVTPRRRPAPGVEDAQGSEAKESEGTG